MSPRPFGPGKAVGIADVSESLTGADRDGIPALDRGGGLGKRADRGNVSGRMQLGDLVKLAAVALAAVAVRSPGFCRLG